MKKQLEVLTFTKNKINVTVKIDYLQKTISLVQQNNFNNKNYLFVGRGLDFIPTWLQIFDAMSYATKEATKLLKEGIENETQGKIKE